MAKMAVGVACAIGAFVAFMMALAMSGCAGATSFDPLTYAQQDADCVRTASTREQADNCRAALRAKHNLPQRLDGGQ